MAIRPTAGAQRLGLGCNAIGHIPEVDAAALVSLALDRGVTVFDTADVYAGGRSEEALGRILPSRRDDLFVITKFGHPSIPRVEGGPCAAENVRRSAEASLRRLRTEQIDCLLIHFPDPLTPFAETLGAIEGLMQDGKVARYGVSNFTPEAVTEIVRVADSLEMARPVLIQEEYSLLRRERAERLLPVLIEADLLLAPFFPLASGLLTGKYLRGKIDSTMRRSIVRGFEGRFLDQPTIERLRRFDELCTRWGVPMMSAALVWLIGRPQVSTVLAGATRAEQFSESLAAVATSLPPAFVAALDALSVANL